MQLRRYTRLARRAMEVPPGFLLRKALTTLRLPVWNAAYRINCNRIGSLLLRDLTPAGPPPPRDDSPWVMLGAQPPLAWASDHNRESDILSVTDPGHVHLIRERADQAALHRVALLGFGELDLGTPIDWHCDHTSGAQWPAKAALRLDYVRPTQQSDVKVAWEVNRLQFLPWLGQAWLTTNDPKYVGAAADIIAHWITRNPVGVGIAWTCAMEVAIRGMNLRTALQMLWTTLDASTRALGWRLLQVHLHYLRRHPELSDVNGNHYFVDLAGVVQLGLAVNAGSHAPNWLSRSIGDFTSEIVRQVHPDGVHLEHSTNYHRIITEVLLSTLVELGRSGYSVDNEILARAERMVEFLADIAGDNGEIPLIGDSDSGQILILGHGSPNNVRHLLATGALLFDRHDIRTNVPTLPPEVVWQLGPSAVPAWDTLSNAPQRCNSKWYPDGGFVALATETSKVITRCGAPGLKGRAAHDHSDLTSFTAELRGIPLLIDTGSSTYTGSREIRKYEISARAHNMLLVDDAEPASFAAGSVMDVVKAPALAHVVDFQPEAPGGPSVTMTHSGYDQLHEVTRYLRQLQLLERGKILKCVDRVEGSDEHRLTAFFFFDQRWSLAEHQKHTIFLRSLISGQVSVIELDPVWKGIAIETAQTAPVYGKRVPSLRVRLEAHVSLPLTITSVFRAPADAV